MRQTSRIAVHGTFVHELDFGLLAELVDLLERVSRRTLLHFQRAVDLVLLAYCQLVQKQQFSTNMTPMSVEDNNLTET